MAVVALAALQRQASAQLVFDNVMNLGPAVNSSSFDEDPRVSSDGLSLYFMSGRAGGFGGPDLWQATRPSTSDLFGGVTNLGAGVNTSGNERWPSISSDGLTLYFNSDRSGGLGFNDLYQATRATIFDPFGSATSLGSAVNSSFNDGTPSISADELTLYFKSNRLTGVPGSADLYQATRATTLDPFGDVTDLGPGINSSFNENGPSISPDELILFFHSTDLPGGEGGDDAWMATRPTTSDLFDGVANLGPAINTSTRERGPSLSFDGSTLYFYSDRPGGEGLFDLYQANVQVIPEPSALALSGIGALGLLALALRRRHRRGRKLQESEGTGNPKP